MDNGLEYDVYLGDTFISDTCTETYHTFQCKYIKSNIEKFFLQNYNPHSILYNWARLLSLYKKSSLLTLSFSAAFFILPDTLRKEQIDNNNTDSKGTLAKAKEGGTLELLLDNTNTSNNATDQKYFRGNYQNCKEVDCVLILEPDGRVRLERLTGSVKGLKPQPQPVDSSFNADYNDSNLNNNNNNGNNNSTTFTTVTTTSSTTGNGKASNKRSSNKRGTPPTSDKRKSSQSSAVKREKVMK